jgi:hypothetical protein
VRPGRPPTARIVRFDYPVEDATRAIEARGAPGIDPAEYERGVKRKGS